MEKYNLTYTHATFLSFTSKITFTVCRMFYLNLWHRGSVRLQTDVNVIYINKIYV